jgi:hypothetical protein
MCTLITFILYLCSTEESESRRIGSSELVGPDSDGSGDELALGNYD